jgi:hypothetical protein
MKTPDSISGKFCRKTSIEIEIVIEISYLHKEMMMMMIKVYACTNLPKQ